MEATQPLGSVLHEALNYDYSLNLATLDHQILWGAEKKGPNFLDIRRMRFGPHLSIYAT